MLPTVQQNRPRGIGAVRFARACYHAGRAASCRTAPGLRTLAGAGLWILTGCGVVVDEPQFDTRAEQRPGTWVRRLESEIRACGERTRT
jgi:hypothetical protein